jgi:DNA-binding NarL/FixJ family response regulator
LLFPPQACGVQPPKTEAQENFLTGVFFSLGSGHQGLSRLTSREFRIVELVTEGLKNREIALAIGTTEQVVKNDMRQIYDKLGFSNRVEVALWCETRKHEGQWQPNF